MLQKKLLIFVKIANGMENSLAFRLHLETKHQPLKTAYSLIGIKGSFSVFIFESCFEG